MNQKEKKIKEVYGNKYKLLCPDENGWISLREAIEVFKVVGNLKFEFGFFDKGNPKKCRDLQLKNIENNNGWFRTDESFPTKSGNYVFLGPKEIQHHIRLQFPLSKEEKLHFKNDFTHYKPETPEPLPIY